MGPGKRKAAVYCTLIVLPGWKELWLRIWPPCSLSFLELDPRRLEVISGQKLGVNIDVAFGA